MDTPHPLGAPALDLDRLYASGAWGGYRVCAVTRVTVAG